MFFLLVLNKYFGVCGSVCSATRPHGRGGAGGEAVEEGEANGQVRMRRNGPRLKSILFSTLQALVACASNTCAKEQAASAPFSAVCRPPSLPSNAPSPFPVLRAASPVQRAFPRLPPARALTSLSRRAYPSSSSLACPSCPSPCLSSKGGRSGRSCCSRTGSCFHARAASVSSS